MTRRRGHALGVFLAALAGVLVGAALVLAVTSHRREATGLPASVLTTPQDCPQIVSKGSQDAITTAVAGVGPAVVSIVTRFRAPKESLSERVLREMRGDQVIREGEGSGTIIDGPHGYILTNAHVVKNAARVVVQLKDGRQFEARVVGADPLSEVAVVQIPGDKSLPQAPLGNSDALPIGAWIVAIGNPYGFQNSVTVGVLSAKDREITGPSGVTLQDLMQTDASINPGNSGGALVDVSGRVVGIPTAEIAQAQGLGFAVPINVARHVADRLVRNGKMPWLGISQRELRPQEARSLHVPDDTGTLVVSVVADSPAARAGVRSLDVIVRAAGTRIAHTGDLSRVVRARNAGDTLPLTVWRAGREAKVTVRLGAVPEKIGVG